MCLCHQGIIPSSCYNHVKESPEEIQWGIKFFLELFNKRCIYKRRSQYQDIVNVPFIDGVRITDCLDAFIKV